MSDLLLPEMNARQRRRTTVRVRRLLIFGLCVGFAAAAIAWRQFTNSRGMPAPGGIPAKELEIARQSYEQQYGRRADRNDSLSWLAEWYLARNRLADAVICFAEIPTSHELYGRMARFQQGRTLLSLHRAVEAESQFRELIALEETTPTIDPKYLIDARQRLRHILEVELRFEERQPLLKGAVERGEADNFEVVAACFPSQLRWNGPQAIEWIEQFYAADATHPIIRTAMGRYLTGQGKLAEGRRLLEEVVREFPDDLRAKAALIACLREADAPEEVTRIMETLPPRSSQDSWLLLLQRGIYALQQGQGKEAAAAYQQVLDTDRTSGQAWQGIASAERLLGDSVKRAHAIKMAAALGRIQNHIGKGIQRASDPNSFIDVADICAEIGLDQEGLILAEYALNLASKNARALTAAKLFESRLNAEKTNRTSDK